MHDENEPFFITEEVEAGMIAAGYKFERSSIACTLRLRDVLEGSWHCSRVKLQGRQCATS